jgi:hypothetical protein
MSNFKEILFKKHFFFKVQIVSLDENTSEFISRSTFDHPYPTTKVMWIPDGVNKILNLFIFFCIFSSKERNFS